MPSSSGPRYILFAEYLQDCSIGQDKQLVAFSAAVGFRDLLNCCKAPVDETVVGICAGLSEPVGGEQRSQRRTSISWHDFVRSEGAVVDSLRQFPLWPNQQKRKTTLLVY